MIERMKCCFNIRFCVILSDSTLRRKSRMSRGVLKNLLASQVLHLFEKIYYMQGVSLTALFLQSLRGQIITKKDAVEGPETD